MVVSKGALEKLRERSIAIQDDGQPAVFDPAFPIGTPKLTNPAPITWAFPAAFPFAAPDAETFGSGAVADRSFVLGRAAAGAENVLCLVQPGRTDADMTFEPVDTLPAVFKGCTELRTARLNDDEILITGVAIDAAAGGNRPRAHAPTAVWNARTGEFFEAEARPEVVIGSS